MKRRKEPPNLEPFFDDEGFFRFRPVSSDAHKAVDLPPLPPRIITFFTRFQSSCVLECCGISALAFKPPVEWDKRWNFNYDVFRWLEAQVETAEEMESPVVRVKEFRQAFYKDDWLLLLRYLMENIEKSKQWK